MKNLIVKSFYFNGPQSAADLAKDLGKSIPNVTRAVNDLLASKILIEDGYAPSTGGRRAIRFKLDPKQNPLFISLAIDQYSTNASIYNVENQSIIDPISIFNPLNQEGAVIKITEAIESILEKSKTPISKIAGIGVTMPGFVDSESGINDSFQPEEILYNLPKYIEKKFDVSTYIENDSSAIAIAEKKFGIAKNISNALVINFNWGVGLGIIVENKLFRGHNGFAGEFSHIPLSNLNKLCSCGKIGCLEVEASLIAAIEFADDKIRSGESSLLQDCVNEQILNKGEAFIRAALSGDQLAINAANKSAYMLGKGIATLIHILNPEKIVISGRGAELGKIILPQIQSAIHEFAIPRLAAQTEIEISELPAKIQLLGSMCLAIENHIWN